MRVDVDQAGREQAATAINYRGAAGIGDGSRRDDANRSQSSFPHQYVDRRDIPPGIHEAGVANKECGHESSLHHDYRSSVSFVTSAATWVRGFGFHSAAE